MKTKTKLIKTTPPTSAALAVASKQPSPRKEDIINAMVERARMKHAEENQKLQEEADAVRAQLETALKELLRANPESFTVQFSLWGTLEIEYRLSMIPPQIEKLKRQYNNMPKLSSFDKVAMKRKIRAGMDTRGDRVKVLLSDPEAVQRLDAALERIAA